jgi:hypothetical protein
VESGDYSLVGQHFLTVKAVNHHDSALFATSTIRLTILSDCPGLDILIDSISPASYDVSLGYAVNLGKIQAMTNSSTCTSQIVYQLIDLDTTNPPDS